MRRSQPMKKSLKTVKGSKVYHAICSQDPNGGWCEEFKTLEEARKAEKDHRNATGHKDTASAAGKCPF
jgi:hypothetical protein